ncbi:hypothetical protein GQ53DRAFT_842827 [Thozetella sp. PMI_491]|nr:hypothetical protein GQ53DRAFT_842827 [Thozetella sp. PMI_491]
MEFSVQVLPKDQASVAFYVAKYKPFRLQALQTDPSCFGSNYAREVAFTDEQWEQRILKPIATVLVATSGEGASRQILSSATLIELDVPRDLVGVPDAVHGGGNGAPLHWAVNGVYTAPEARRLGISAEVMAAAAREAQVQAAARGRDCLLTVLVANHNAGARSLYEKCGYTYSNETSEGGMEECQLFRYITRESPDRSSG